MQKRILFVAIAVALAGAAAAPAAAQDADSRGSGGVIPISHVGSNARIGLGLDQDGNVQGEALGIFGYDGTRAFLAEGWLGDGGAGGIKFAYNWLWGSRSVDDSIHAPDTVLVTKLFAALDQNAFDDRKATLGFGWERRKLGVDLYYARALTDERLIAHRSERTVEQVTGNDGGRPYRQEITIDTLTEQFEHPYQHGVGVRFSRYFEPALLRVRAGLDHERGSAMLAGDHAEQTSASLALEKFISGSGHSIAASLEYLRKQGPFDRPQFGGARSDTRAALLWRYEFGTPHRPTQDWREVEVVREIVEPATAPIEASALRNEVELSGEALFAFDSAALMPAAEVELAGLLQVLRTSRVGEIEIVGHTCDIGSERYNQGLSERRAEAVRDWLLRQGVDTGDLRVFGRGELAPRHPNDSEDNRRRNRRVELSFVTVEEIEPPSPPPTTRTVTEWRREPVPMPAAWIERALRNPPAHKRSVDTYRIERVSETRSEGPREFINRPPMAVDDSATTPRHTPVAIDVLANDSDPDGDDLILVSVTPPGSGSARIEAGGIVYTPAQGFVGVDSFTYTIADPDGLTSSATVTVTIEAPGNEPPIANPDSAQTQSGVAVDIDVLANDSDPEDDPLTVVAVSQPGNGSVVIAGNGIVTYTSNVEFVGSDFFSYTIEDSHGNTASAQVTVVVSPFDPNRPPVAVDDTASLRKGGVVDIHVLANDYDPDGDPLTITQVIYPSNRADVTIEQNGRVIRYDHRPGYFGEDALEYEITDGRGGFDRARVLITIYRE